MDKHFMKIPFIQKYGQRKVSCKQTINAGCKQSHSLGVNATNEGHKNAKEENGSERQWEN